MEPWLIGLLALGVAAAWWARARRARLPLVLGRVHVRDEVLGRPVLRVRACLGDGRVVATWSAQAVWRAQDGDRPARPQEAPGPRVGAWTLTFPDPPDGAELAVTITAVERGHAWQAQGAWPVSAATLGRFAPLLEGRPGRWRVSPRWDAVAPPQLGADG